MQLDFISQVEAAFRFDDITEEREHIAVLLVDP